MPIINPVVTGHVKEKWITQERYEYLKKMMEENSLDGVRFHTLSATLSDTGLIEIEYSFTTDKMLF